MESFLCLFSLVSRSPAAMARLALGEALTNLVWARATALQDVRASVNWMYAAKVGRIPADSHHSMLSVVGPVLAERVERLAAASSPYV